MCRYSRKKCLHIFKIKNAHITLKMHFLSNRCKIVTRSEIMHLNELNTRLKIFCLTK